MGLKLRSGLAGLREHESKRRDLAPLGVNRQLETFREQTSHHHAHLIFGRIPASPCLNVEAFRHHPAWQLRHQEMSLITDDVVSEKDIRDERKVRGREEAP